MYELYDVEAQHFPAFGRGLSLRLTSCRRSYASSRRFPRLRAGTFIEAGTAASAGDCTVNFPAFGRGLSLRPRGWVGLLPGRVFPRLRAGTFIEAQQPAQQPSSSQEFPRLRAGTFIEAVSSQRAGKCSQPFPRLRAGTFIEAMSRRLTATFSRHFPAFGRGLSLRRRCGATVHRLWRAFPRLRAGTFIEAKELEEARAAGEEISPPSGGDFH